MKGKSIYLLIIVSFYSFGQNLQEDIHALNGVWIAEDYYKAFEGSHSAIQCKKSFYHSDPVALRINSNEIKDGIMNIGYSVLHDHILHPEVSEYMIKNNDTIREQGSFKINLNKKDSIGYYKTSEIYYFNYDWVSYITWDKADTSITIYRPKNDMHEEAYIRYRRIHSTLEKDYQYPNPLYYYTRLKTLIGNYTLKDGSGKTISTNLNINKNGLLSGYEGFEGFTVYFSTDVYCGPPVSNDFIIIVEDILDEDSQSFIFSYQQRDNGDIMLYEKLWTRRGNIEVVELGSLKYQLIKTHP